MALALALLAALAADSHEAQSEAPRCALVRGVKMPGIGGHVAIVRAQQNTHEDDPLPSLSLAPTCARPAAGGCLEQSTCDYGSVEARFGSRSYLLPGEESIAACANQHFNNTFKYSCIDYAAGSMKLSGKMLSFEVDLSGAGCGCNVALYLVSMPQNREPSACNDFYCDANNVCDVTCAEIDLMEANNVAFVSTVHVADDGNGEGYGLGHYVMHKHNRFSSNVRSPCPYGPNGHCTIDTRLPFKASYAFTDEGEPFGFITTLQQGEKFISAGPVMYTQRPTKGDKDVETANALLRERLDAGMTLVLSHWSGEQRKDMSWLDSPCFEEEREWCSDGFTDMFDAHMDHYRWGCEGDDQELPPECPDAVVLTDITVVSLPPPVASKTRQEEPGADRH